MLKESAMLALVGVSIGVPAAFAATSMLAHHLYGMSASDPATLAAAAGVMLVVSLVAGYVPARRASLTMPTVALRCAATDDQRAAHGSRVPVAFVPVAQMTPPIVP